MSNDAQVLIIDDDTGAAQKVGLALDSAGLGVTWCSFSPSEVAEALRDFRPSLLLVHAEPGAPQLASLLARSEASPVPVVLLCQDLADEAFVRAMRGGVVELLEAPFNARLHVKRLRALAGELPDRTGELQGRGRPGEVSALVHHLMRTRRTGGLALGGDGRAFFVRGVLKAARFKGQTGQSALAAMTREQVPWTFTEDIEGASSLVDFMGEEPALVVAPRDGTPLPAPAPAPAASAAAPPGPTASGVAPAADPDAPRTPILFVDDDPAIVAMMANYFSKKGYPVATAADGVEAMQLLTARPFEVVLSDLNMPRLDGWGLLRLIREDLRTHEVPVALFTAHDDYREALRLQQAGAQAYFSKSLKLTALEVQVRELGEPRRRFTRLVPTEGGLEFDFGALGPQWTVRALAQAGYSGHLDARDAWGTWRLTFAQGRLTQATAHMGTAALVGDRALGSFLTAKDPHGSLAPGGTASGEGFGGQPTPAILQRLVPVLAEEQRRAQDAHLARARALTVHDDLYRLYLTVGPPAWQPMVRMLCEQRLTPAEVMARLQVTPQELAAVVKDLLRRGVASLAE